MGMRLHLNKLNIEIDVYNNNHQLMDTITFEHECEWSSDGKSPYIQIAHPDDDINSLIDADAIVTPQAINVLFSYPLERPVVVKFDNGPYTRRRLAEIICKKYEEIYEEEDQTSTVEAGRLSQISLNRNQTTGKYGIWGHVIGDLVLHSVYFDTRTGFYELGVDS